MLVTILLANPGAITSKNFFGLSSADWMLSEDVSFVRFLIVSLTVFFDEKMSESSSESASANRSSIADFGLVAESAVNLKKNSSRSEIRAKVTIPTNYTNRRRYINTGWYNVALVRFDGFLLPQVRGHLIVEETFLIAEQIIRTIIKYILILLRRKQVICEKVDIDI